jgi:dTDP-4-amino-4,6-dideoxygalactose transaminase
MLVTNAESIDQRLRRLRVHGGATEYHHEEVGINSRLDALQAAILRVKLKHLEQWTEARRGKAAYYDELFRETTFGYELSPPFVRPDARHIFHQYVIRVPHYRDDVMKHLARFGVGSKIYYPVALHLQECFAYLGYRDGEFPEAERAALETLALPCFPELSEEQQRYVVDVLSKFHP